MRAIRILLAEIAVGTLLFGLLAWGMHGYYGLGYFRQVVIFESTRPVVKVSYDSCAVDDKDRRLAESFAEPEIFDFDGFEPATLDGDRFTARIKWTDGPDIWNGPRHLPQLAVLAEFADGTRACRVVDIRKRIGKKPIVVQFP